MTVPITLQLSDSLVEQAQRVSSATQQNLEAVLLDALELMGLTWNHLSEDTFPKPIATLSDREILELATSKMSPAQSQRLGDLQAQGKDKGITEPERYELMALLQIYQIGLLRKSEAIAEAKARHLELSLQA